jgi:hypothetical protein
MSPSNGDLGRFLPFVSDFLNAIFGIPVKMKIQIKL